MVRPYEPDKPGKALREYASEIVENAKRLARESGFSKVTGYLKQGQPARTIISFAKHHLPLTAAYLSEIEKDVPDPSG